MAFIRFERCYIKTIWLIDTNVLFHIMDIMDVLKTSHSDFPMCVPSLCCVACALCALLCGAPHQRSSRWFQTGNTWSRWRQGWHHISSLSPECRHRPRPRLPRRPRRSAPWDLPSWINAGGPTWGCSAACGGGGGVTLSPTHPARPAVGGDEHTDTFSLTCGIKHVEGGRRVDVEHEGLHRFSFYWHWQICWLIVCEYVGKKQVIEEINRW